MIAADQFSKVNTHDADPDNGIAEHILRLSRISLGHLEKPPHYFTYHVLCERNTGLEAKRLYQYLATKLSGLRFNFYVEHNDRNDVVSGFFLDKKKEDVCTMMRDRVNNNAFRISNNFGPLCSAEETKTDGPYNAGSLITHLENEFRNFQVKLKHSKTNLDLPPKRIYSGKKGYGFDDLVLALSENNYNYWSNSVENP